MSDACLPKSEVIKRSARFAGLYEAGERWSGKTLRFVFQPADGRQVGFAVSRRYGNAVQRNRVKRWMREAYRKHRLSIQNWAFVVSPKKRRHTDSFHEIEKEMIRFINMLKSRS